MENPDPKFYEARAIVLSKMGQHRQALDIYVFKLKDADKAEECATPSLHSFQITNVLTATATKSNSLKALPSLQTSQKVHTALSRPIFKIRPPQSTIPCSPSTSPHRPHTNRNGVPPSLSWPNTAPACPPRLPSISYPKSSPSKS